MYEGLLYVHLENKIKRRHEDALQRIKENILHKICDYGLLSRVISKP
jgi:hypothetical protein